MLAVTACPRLAFAANSAPAPEGPAPAPEPAMDVAGPAESSEGPDEASRDPEPAAELRIPRVDGPYFGGTVSGAGAFARVQNLDTPSPLSGFVLDLRAGNVVFPWMTIGAQILGGAGWVSDQRVAHGGLLMDFGFLPVPRVPFSLRAGFGFGAGAVRDDDETKRFGFGGALFKAGARYEFFPNAQKRRPRRGGGWAIGPEINWLGYTPTAAGQPMNNVLTIGIWSAIYFGE